MRLATVGRPYVNHHSSTTRVGIHIDPLEINLVDEDTGEVIYTTPCLFRNMEGRAIQGLAAQEFALRRAHLWLRRHSFRYNPVDHGYWTRKASR